ncbi:hypothetical protein ACWEKR_11310 [Nocardia sp. NPDC004573]
MSRTVRSHHLAQDIRELRQVCGVVDALDRDTAFGIAQRLDLQSAGPKGIHHTLLIMWAFSPARSSPGA